MIIGWVRFQKESTNNINVASLLKYLKNGRTTKFRTASATKTIQKGWERKATSSRTAGFEGTSSTGTSGRSNRGDGKGTWYLWYSSFKGAIKKLGEIGFEHTSPNSDASLSKAMKQLVDFLREYLQHLFPTKVVANFVSTAVRDKIRAAFVLCSSFVDGENSESRSSEVTVDLFGLVTSF